MTERPRRPEGDPTAPTQRPRGVLTQIAGGVVRVVEGRDKGLELRLKSRSLKIGKGEDTDLTLTDPAVSRLHAVIEPTLEGCVIEDLGSKNGILIHGIRVKSAVLAPGVRLQLGDTILEYTSQPERFMALPEQEPRLGELVGSSSRMREIFGLIRQVARSEVTVILNGETGTGKELAARAIHSFSKRSGGPFIVFDCANVNPDLMGSELFGHRKGAFTGATSDHRGAFERANKGTLFLDEVGELPLEVQGRLLGALQRREILPVGGSDPMSVDVRIVAATNRNLERMMTEGTWRQDLYYRLAVMTIELPPLRQRLEDVPLLVDSFVKELTPSGEVPPRVPPEVLDHLGRQTWPGNVRELRNAIERAMALTEGGELRLDRFAGAKSTAGPGGPTEGGLLEGNEKLILLTALERCDWNKTRAAKELGIGLATLKRKIQRYGLSRPGASADEAVD